MRAGEIDVSVDNRHWNVCGLKTTVGDNERKSGPCNSEIVVKGGQVKLRSQVNLRVDHDESRALKVSSHVLLTRVKT